MYKYNEFQQKNLPFEEILSFRGSQLCDSYSTRRLVAVSGKMTQGRNCLASSKSISA